MFLFFTLMPRDPPPSFPRLRPLGPLARDKMHASFSPRRQVAQGVKQPDRTPFSRRSHHVWVPWQHGVVAVWEDRSMQTIFPGTETMDTMSRIYKDMSRGLEGTESWETTRRAISLHPKNSTWYSSAGRHPSESRGAWSGHRMLFLLRLATCGSRTCHAGTPWPGNQLFIKQV